MKSLVTFLKDDSGAVTTDFVLVTAGLVGLGLATISVVSGGVEDTSFEIAAALANIDVISAAQELVASFDFSDGNAAGWIGGRVMNMGGQLGELLVLGPGQSTSYLFEIQAGTELATMTFDLVGGDSLDNSVRWGVDTGVMMINGVPIAVATTNGREGITLQIPQNDGTTVEAVVTVNAAHLGGNASRTDSVANVTVQVSRPTDDLQFQFTSNANQSIQDEFWGLDNFETSVTRGSGF